VQALDVGAVDAARCVVRAAGIEDKKAPRVLRGAQQAVGIRVNDDAAARVARAQQMGVAVPDLRRIDALPSGRDQLVAREARRQRRAAGIPEALLGPVAPRGRAERGRAGAQAC